MGYLTVAGTFHWLMDSYPVERIPCTQHSLKLDRFGPYNPRSVLCDYEIDLHNAVIIWIGALFGCRKTPILHKTPIKYK